MLFFFVVMHISLSLSEFMFFSSYYFQLFSITFINCFHFIRLVKTFSNLNFFKFNITCLSAKAQAESFQFLCLLVSIFQYTRDKLKKTFAVLLVTLRTVSPIAASFAFHSMNISSFSFCVWLLFVCFLCFFHIIFLISFETFP